MGAASNRPKAVTLAEGAPQELDATAGASGAGPRKSCATNATGTCWRRSPLDHQELLQQLEQVQHTTHPEVLKELVEAQQEWHKAAQLLYLQYQGRLHKPA